MDELESGVVHKPPQSGSYSVGVDLGATLAKVAVRDPAGGLRLEIVPARNTRQLVDLIANLEPAQIGLTGGGASPFSELLDIPSKPHDEFASWGRGARHFTEAENPTGDSRNLLVSLGTGTSVLLLDGDTTTRIGGTALGGGTILGLANALLGTSNFEQICQLATQGDRTKVDLVVGDIYRPGEIALPDELTAASFGKLGLAADPPGGKDAENLAAAILGLVGENVGLICAGLSYACEVQDVVFAGSTLRDNLFLRNILASITVNMGRTPHFLPNAEYGAAVGALLLCDGDD